jgi:hypothetical protein
MQRITATAIAVVAYVVVQLEAWWNRANLSFVSKPMDILHSSICGYVAVATSCLRARPDVASILIFDPARATGAIEVPWDKDSNHAQQFSMGWRAA